MVLDFDLGKIKGSFTLVAGRCDCRRGQGRIIGKISISQPSVAGRSRFTVECESALMQNQSALVGLEEM